MMQTFTQSIPLPIITPNVHDEQRTRHAVNNLESADSRCVTTRATKPPFADEQTLGRAVNSPVSAHEAQKPTLNPKIVWNYKNFRNFKNSPNVLIVNIFQKLNIFCLNPRITQVNTPCGVSLLEKKQYSPQFCTATAWAANFRENSP